MLLGWMPFLLLVVFPAGLALLFGVFQGLLAVKLDCKTPLLPAVTGLGALLCLTGLCGPAAGMGEQLNCAIALFWIGSSFAGSLAGWGLSWAVEVLRERRMRSDHEKTKPNL